MSVLTRPSVVIFVCSSTGEGDPPDNSTRFFGKLKRFIRDQKKTPDELKFASCRFTILGLGDSNYSSFQGAPRSLHKMMTTLGANYFHPREEIDEVKGVEEFVEKWIETLWDPLAEAVGELQAQEGGDAPKKKPVFKRKINLKGGPSVPPCRFQWADVAPDTPHKSGPSVHHNAPFTVQLLRARWLTSVEAKKKTVEMTFALPEAFAQFQPGDSFGIHCPNHLSVVDRVLARLGVDENRVVGYHTEDEAALPTHLKEAFPTTIKNLLLWIWDLTSLPRKSFLRMLAEYCSVESEKQELIHLASTDGKSVYAQQIEATHPTLADLLDLYPSCKPSAEHVISCLPSMAPRYYSFACAPSQEARVAFSLADIHTASGQVREGLCTYWLANLAVANGLLEADGYFTPSPVAGSVPPGTPIELAAFQYKAPKFRLPTSEEGLAKPHIMIGPGTGVAPFLGFLESLVLTPAEKRGETWLFFGCRHPDRDYLYREELEQFVERGVLQLLVTAFSRATEDVVYVQHRLLEERARVASLLLEEGANVYICGDAKGMAKDVTATITQIVQEHKQCEASDAAAVVNQMIQDDQILFDVWS